MKLFYSISLILFGIILFYITYKDGKKRRPQLTTSYIIHLKGYFGGFGVILIGLLILCGYLK